MKYCIRCGRTLSDQQACERCGRTYQLDGKEWRDTKKCKKCHQAIPVNANFCPFCDYDQAKIVWDDQPRSTATAANSSQAAESEGMDFARQLFMDIFEDQMDNSTSNSRSNHSRSQSLSNYQPDAETQRLTQMVRQQTQRPPRPRIITQLNETARPGLLASTRLALRDAFKYNKRMGRADYWYAQLGMFLLVIVASMLAGVILSGLRAVLGVAAFTQVTYVVVIIIAVGYLLVNFSATVRRLHDVGLPGALAILIFLTTLGQLIVWILATLPHNPQATQFDFGTTPPTDPGAASTHATSTSQAAPQHATGVTPSTTATRSNSHAAALNAASSTQSVTNSQHATATSLAQTSLPTETFYPKSQRLATSERPLQAPTESTSENE